MVVTHRRVSPKSSPKNQSTVQSRVQSPGNRDSCALISAQLSRFSVLANLRLATPDNRMETITRSARGVGAKAKRKEFQR